MAKRKEVNGEEQDHKKRSKTGTHAKAKAFAFVNCEDSVKWSDLLEAYWKPVLGAEGDNWTEFKAWEGHIPTEADFAQFDGFVIPGSHHATYDDKTYAWIVKVHEFVRSLRAWQKKQLQAGKQHVPRLVGSCFGHQTIAHSLGGLTAPNPSKAFVLGAEELSVTPAFHSWAKQLDVETGDTKVLTMLESHGDQVHKLPAEDARLLAGSPSAPHEMFLVGNEMFGSQCHPEFVPADITDKILPTIQAAGRLTEKQAEQTCASCKKPLSQPLVQKLVRKWFRQSDD